MKTNQEIQAEARQVLALGRQYQNEQWMVSARTPVEPRVLVHLPVNVSTPGRERQVEAVAAGSELLFMLIERTTDRAAADRDEREGEALVVASSASAYDVLKTGYELAEEERLAAALEPYAERSEDRADGDTVAEVEAILETNLLPHTERLRTKMEIVEFLEGRLEPSLFITRAIERQCSREDYREHLAERHELKLTMGGP
jgi:hypothetical protein